MAWEREQGKHEGGNTWPVGEREREGGGRGCPRHGTQSSQAEKDVSVSSRLFPDMDRAAAVSVLSSDRFPMCSSSIDSIDCSLAVAVGLFTLPSSDTRSYESYYITWIFVHTDDF